MGKAEQGLPERGTPVCSPAGSAALSPHAEASKMLEEALQQMDGIIAGTRLELSNLPDSPGNGTTDHVGGRSAIAEAVEQLRAAVDASIQDPLPEDVQTSSIDFLLQWFRQQTPVVELEDRLGRLESEKESLQLQVSVLGEQIDAQSEKIGELERLLDEKKQQLERTEDMLQRELLVRSSLETQKLELMTDVSDLRLRQAGLEKDNISLRERLRGSHADVVNMVAQMSEDHRRNPFGHSIPRGSLPCTSTPQGSQRCGTVASPSPSPVSLSSLSRRSGCVVAGSVEDIPPPRTPPANFRRRVDCFGTLPRTADRPPLGSPMMMDVSSSPAETERLPENIHRFDGSLTPSPQSAAKTKGLRKIFGRLRRSGSGSLDGDSLAEPFQRGGVRATAGPRLGWSTDVKEIKGPFETWDCDSICAWMEDLGLSSYLPEIRRWVRSGAQLLSASNQDLDKELGIKHPLHRKKLQLALADRGAMCRTDTSLALAGRLDCTWVLRWLDDVGLPQYKDPFLTARVDGRVLHRLALEDLPFLHVSSALHVASLRRGIQVLRDQQFDPECLCRRSVPEEYGPASANDVALWTNHRVMEWLRAVDLAEYAPNLRGSGVHGGLMVHEPRFTSDLLASLLSIPPSKTLLRRHLATHFKELLGRDVVQVKREAEAAQGYVPLSATTKVKVTKKSQFTLRRKKSRADFDLDDLVCPFDPSSPAKSELAESPGSRRRGGCFSGE